MIGREGGRLAAVCITAWEAQSPHEQSRPECARGAGGYNIDLKNVDAKSELFRTNRFMSQMMHQPSLDALTLSESLLRTCLAAPRETVL